MVQFDVEGTGSRRTEFLFRSDFSSFVGDNASYNVDPRSLSLQQPALFYIIRAVISILSQKINLQRRNLRCSHKSATRPMSSCSSQARLNVIHRHQTSYVGRLSSHATKKMVTCVCEVTQAVSRVTVLFVFIILKLMLWLGNCNTCFYKLQNLRLKKVQGNYKRTDNFMNTLFSVY
jgi:hypothetical protein